MATAKKITQVGARSHCSGHWAAMGSTTDVGWTAGNLSGKQVPWEMKPSDFEVVATSQWLCLVLIVQTVECLG